MISSLELARLCGVSQGTVDRALHNRPGVSIATKARILETAKKHGYLPHPAMQEMLSGKSDLIGAVVPSVNTPFFMDLMQAAADEFLAHKVRLLITPVSNRKEFLAALEEFAARRFRGALVVPPEENIHIPAAISFPIATFLSACTASSTHLFAPDEQETGRIAVDYLLKQGHTQILHVTYSRNTSGIKNRAKGYADAMQQAGLEPHVHTDNGPASFMDVVEKYKPTAIFCHNDWLALEIIRRLGLAGLRVPEDISVMGVDNSPTFAALYPGMTTMHYPIAEIARDAVAWMLGGGEPANTGHISLVSGETLRRIT